MKISYNWLKEYVDVNDSPQELADKLTMAGIEVEEIISTLPEFSGVVIARVDAVAKHPNADKLSVCEVFDGSKTHHVVCGAPNVASGQIVPFAPVGTTLPIGIKLKKAKIRGVESHGMICSEEELGLADQSDGIWELAQDWQPGQDLYQRLSSEQDYILDLSITPNRPDAMSMVGVAREVAAINKTTCRLPEFSLKEIGDNTADCVKVEIQNPEGCPRYTARVIRGITVKESPQWMQDRLLKSGIRPINNIVDITNYVLLELGQPLHAFDLKQIAGHTIIVRDSLPGEQFVTLDEKQRQMPQQTVMICDADKAVAVGGVMGGMNSEVSQGTVDVLLESAYFTPVRVARASKKLGLSSEASQRFERGADPGGVTRAANRAAALMADLAGGEVLAGIVDAYVAPVKQRQIQLRSSRVNLLLGTQLSDADIANVLKRLEIDYQHGQAKIPSFRPDLEREVDLIEEVARSIGFDQIPVKEQTVVPFDVPLNIEDLFYDFLKAQIRELGFSEIQTNSMISAKELLADEQQHIIRVLNPISDDMGVMRRSLLPGLLRTAAYNINRNRKDLRLFEMGRVFLEIEDQPYRLAGLLHGLRHVGGWDSTGLTIDYYDVKGYVESFLNKIFLDNFEFILYDNNGYFSPSEAVAVYKNSNRIGFFGRVDENVTEAYDLSSAVYAFEFSVAALWKYYSQQRWYQPFSRYPFVEKDVAFIVDTSIHSKDLADFILRSGKPLLSFIDVFDVYTGDRLSEGKKSIAFKLRFQSDSRTLSDSEVNKIFNKIIRAVESKFKARLREN